MTEEKHRKARGAREENVWRMRCTEHLSGGVAWPARDLYLADDGECPACRRTFDGVEPTTALVCCATAICRTCHQACLRRAQSDSRFTCPLCREDFVNDPAKPGRSVGTYVRLRRYLRSLWSLRPYVRSHW